MIGVVVIGRNEGDRLRYCLTSVVPLQCPIVYVDSGSTDGSVALANELGVDVLELDLTVPFTAARARNAGFERLIALSFNTSEKPPKLVQFIDGDSTLEEGWMDAALSHMERVEDCSVVAGHLREEWPDKSLYNLMCDIEWRSTTGPADAVGGIALYRADAFKEVGGFDPGLICGEEPELCYRLRQRGWRVWRIDHPMARHDADMMAFNQWWKRCVRAGWAFAEGAYRYGSSKERYNVRPVLRILLWAFILPALLFLSLLTSVFASLSPTAEHVQLILVATIVAAYAFIIAKTALYRRRSFDDPWNDVLVYGSMTTLGKFAELIGLFKFLRHRFTQAEPTIIEYKKLS